MATEKLTELALSPVFPMTVKPVRDGVYKVNYRFATSRPMYSRWSNGRWHLVHDVIKVAAVLTEVSADCADPQHVVGWQGLAAQPK